MRHHRKVKATFRSDPVEIALISYHASGDRNTCLPSLTRSADLSVLARVGCNRALLHLRVWLHRKYLIRTRASKTGLLRSKTNFDFSHAAGISAEFHPHKKLKWTDTIRHSLCVSGSKYCVMRVGSAVVLKMDSNIRQGCLQLSSKHRLRIYLFGIV